MKDEQVVIRLMSANEQLARLRAHWYRYGLGFAHYSSDFTPILLLAIANLPDEELLARLREAQDQYRRQHENPNSPISFFNSDTLPLLGLALLPAEAEESMVVSSESATAELPPVDKVLPPVAFNPVAAEPAADEVALATAERTVADPIPDHVFAGNSPIDPVIQRVEPMRFEDPSGVGHPPPIFPSPEAVSREHIPAVRACPHVGSDGKCSGCTGDRLEACSGCPSGEDEYPAVELIKCKDEDCEEYFCSTCRRDTDYFSKNGYCNEHATVVCDNCKESAERESEVACSNRRCRNNVTLCKDCADRRLNKQGRCDHCSNEEIDTCDKCDNEFISSRLVDCANEDCNQCACADCKDEFLDKKGYCPNCEPDEDEEDLLDDDEDKDEEFFEEEEEEDGLLDEDDEGEDNPFDEDDN